MQNMWLLQGICDSLDIATRQFICGSTSSHWVSWKTIIQPKNNGVLRVRPTRDANIAMLGKHIWTILHCKTKLWLKLVNAKCFHGEFILHRKEFPGSSYTWALLVDEYD